MEEVANSVTPVIGDIRKEWHWVRPGLEDLLSSNPDVKTLPEDVYHSIKCGNAHLWVTPTYFVITTFETCDASGEKVLLLWFAWSSDRGNRESLQGNKFFEDVARSSGCSAIEIQTRHQALIDYSVSELGYRVRTQILSKDLSE